jgi:hypothetical protein
MNTVFFDSPLDDDARRKELYRGQLFAYSPTTASLELVEVARRLIREAFGSLEPTTAQYHMPVEQYAAILAELKPKFIHHPESKKCIQGILKEFGCDLQKTYFDVPRMRTSTSDSYLTSGIAYAFHPHRDTWYSAPYCQLNWWFPIYDIASDNSMAFHPRYWYEPVKNGSREYNYAEWNKVSRQNAAQHIKADTRKQPHADEPLELDPQIRIITKPGGIIIFAGAQMHSSVPNTSGSTRFSIDFRTVHLGDVMELKGAPNLDSECTGTTMGDYLRGTDLAHISDDIINRYEPGPPKKATFEVLTDR